MSDTAGATVGAVPAGVDVGGTFTDVVVLAGGTPRAVKAPTTPDDQSDGVAAALEQATDAQPVSDVAHGTTTATNAVLEGKVARTVLVVTEGFTDILEIGRQHRPSLYDLSVVRPRPLVEREMVVTVRERTGPDGRAVIALDDEEVGRVARAVVEQEPQSVAVCLLFSYAGPDHEERLRRALEQALPGVPVTRSSALLPEFREYERASTCVLNAAVRPVMRRYLERLDERVAGGSSGAGGPSRAGGSSGAGTRVTVMTSGGGTAGTAYAADAPVHTLLSGPAAGVVAAGAVALAAGFPDAVAFDMGGTSTDVCLIRGGRPQVATDAEIGGLPFRTPAVDIHTVGAGGGSIAWVDKGGALRVGPQSAGAVPGPACYGHGGTDPTVTDAHCELGHLDLERTLGGAVRLRPDAARDALATLPDTAGGGHGILAVVRATMVRALRRVTTERGVDPGTLALVAYGGAGPLHATALARELGCAAVVVPPVPGVLSALGLLLAPPRHEVSRTVMAAAGDDLAAAWQELEGQARQELTAQGAGNVTRVTRLADLRYAGQSHELRVEVAADASLAETLATAHTEAYGYALPDEQVKVVTLRVAAEGHPVLTESPVTWDLGSARPDRARDIGVDGRMTAARVLDRAGLREGDAVEGPALIEQPDTTTLLGYGERAEVDGGGNLVVALDD